MALRTKVSGDGKQRLMKAARNAFAFEGYALVGVAQILQEAGVQAPTLYHHYGDKEGLYVEWACFELTEVESLTATNGESSTETNASLSAMAGILLHKVPFDLRQLLRDVERLQRPENRERVTGAYLQAVYNPLYAIMVRGIARGDLRPEPIRSLTETFVAGTMALAKHVQRSSEGNEDMAAWWIRMFLHGCAR